MRHFVPAPQERLIFAFNRKASVRVLTDRLPVAEVSVVPAAHKLT